MKTGSGNYQKVLDVIGENKQLRTSKLYSFLPQIEKEIINVIVCKLHKNGSLRRRNYKGGKYFYKLNLKHKRFAPKIKKIEVKKNHPKQLNAGVKGEVFFFYKAANNPVSNKTIIAAFPHVAKMTLAATIHQLFKEGRLSKVKHGVYQFKQDKMAQWTYSVNPYSRVGKVLKCYENLKEQTLTNKQVADHFSGLYLEQVRWSINKLFRLGKITRVSPGMYQFK